MIKAKLKEIDIKLIDFAKMLGISRPTLDNYIEIYESGEKIPKDKYEYIFRNLFSKDIKEKDKFLEVLDKYHELIERDKTLGTFDLPARSTDLINLVLNNIKNDMYTDDYDEKVYIFVNMLITSYKRERIFKDFVDYFLILNSKISINDIEEDEDKKIFISNCFKLMRNYKEGKLAMDNEYYRKFIKRIESVKAETDRNTEKLKDDFMEKVNKEIKLRLKLGLEVDDIDIKELISNLEL